MSRSDTSTLNSYVLKAPITLPQFCLVRLNLLIKSVVEVKLQQGHAAKGQSPVGSGLGVQNCGAVQALLAEPRSRLAEASEVLLLFKEIRLDSLRFGLHGRRQRIIDCDSHNSEEDAYNKAGLEKLPDGKSCSPYDYQLRGPAQSQERADGSDQN